jgi:hypothetical protein
MNIHKSIYTITKWSKLRINLILLLIVIQLVILNYKLLVQMNPAECPSGDAFDLSVHPIDKIIDSISALYYSICTIIILKIALDNHIHIMFAWFGLVEGMTYFLIYSGFYKFPLIGAVLFALYSGSLLWALGFYQHYEMEDPPKEREENRLTILRKQMYNRTKFLKYNHKSNEEDPLMINLKKEINKLINSRVGGDS